MAANTTVKKFVVLLWAALFLLVACGEDSKSDPAAQEDTSIVNIDASDTAQVEDTSPPPEPRTMIDDSPLPRLPVNNRVYAAGYRPMFENIGASDGSEDITSQLWRFVYPETPYPEPSMQLPSAANASMYHTVMLGDGFHHASVWIGLTVELSHESSLADLESTTVSMVSFRIADATTEPVAVDLDASSSSLIEKNGRLWMQFEGTFAARDGLALMTIQAPSVMIHAPIVQLTEPSQGQLQPLSLRPRALLERERALLAVFKHRLKQDDNRHIDLRRPR